MSSTHSIAHEIRNDFGVPFTHRLLFDRDVLDPANPLVDTVFEGERGDAPEAGMIAVIDQGRVIAEGTADQLKDRIGGDRLIVTIATMSNLERAKGALSSMATGPIEISATLPELVVPIRPGDRVVPNAIRALDDCACDVIDVELRRPSLDDVFLTITGSSPDDFSATEGPA